MKLLKTNQVERPDSNFQRHLLDVLYENDELSSTKGLSLPNFMDEDENQYESNLDLEEFTQKVENEISILPKDDKNTNEEFLKKRYFIKEDLNYLNLESFKQKDQEINNIKNDCNTEISFSKENSFKRENSNINFTPDQNFIEPPNMTKLFECDSLEAKNSGKGLIEKMEENKSHKEKLSNFFNKDNSMDEIPKLELRKNVR